MRTIQNLLMIMSICSLFVVGCSPATTDLNNSGNSGESAQPNEKTDKEITDAAKESELVDYFLPDTSKAMFIGEGNEYADLDIDYAHPFKNYVIVHENNGGTLIRYIYKIESDQILRLDQRVIELKEDFPSLDELQAMEPNGIYLEKPFEVGTIFDEWKIVETDITLETPYQTFDHVFVIESTSDDAVNRKYFAKGFGEVKRESVMTMTNGEEYKVTSTLSSVSKP